MFVDTSALYAVMVANDPNHPAASRCFDALGRRRRHLVTTSYNTLEMLALLQRRIGLDAVEAWRAELQPLLEIVWIDSAFHDRALQRLLDLGDRRVSLTDCASFVCMEDHAIKDAFAFDAHFAAQGFRLLPSP